MNIGCNPSLRQEVTKDVAILHTQHIQVSNEGGFVKERTVDGQIVECFIVALRDSATLAIPLIKQRQFRAQYCRLQFVQSTITPPRHSDVVLVHPSILTKLAYTLCR